MAAYPRVFVLPGLTLAAVLTLTAAAPPAPVAGTAGVGVAIAGGPDPAGSFRSVRTHHGVAAPVRLRIPALDVDTPLEPIGRQSDGSIAVPRRADVAGWWRDGPRPGQPGPAVIVGHVDSATGPGVFARLNTLRPGALLRVERADGSAAVFALTRLSRVPKDRFPTDLVYAPTLDHTLRLVTCGGTFDRAKGSYRDNVIAYAELV